MPRGADQPVLPVAVSDGRHSWPGRSPADVVHGPVTGVEERVAADVDQLVPETVSGPDTLPSRAADPERRPGAHSQRRPHGLIHPTVVDGAPSGPPPRPSETGVDGVAPAPRSPHESERPVLKRRVPQTHLAPELIRRRPSPTAAMPGGHGNGNGHNGNGNGNGGNGYGGNGHGDDHSGPAPSGALSALSQYQASRRAARDALSEDPARADAGAARGDDTDTHDGGRS